MGEIESAALYKAAYRVLTERWPPHNCVTDVRRWADDQPSHIASAYNKATIMVAQAAREWWQKHTESFEAEKAYRELIKPPPPTELIKPENRMALRGP